MNKEQLFDQIRKKNSYLCVGLDTDPERVPKHLLGQEDPVFAFNKQIIDATAPYCVAYKPNTAFYEAQGAQGWASLQKTLEYIPDDFLTIADAKRGDIGNTSRLYARAFFEKLGADALTVAPYMGEDSIRPFLEFKDKWVILLGHTSNSGSMDFQAVREEGSGEKLYERVIRKSKEWGSPDQLMFVVGATHGHNFAHIRRLAPDHFFLVPGIGAQGGDLKSVSEQGMNHTCGLLVNSSRSIIYASDQEDFAEQAAREAWSIQQEMEEYLDAYL